MMNTTFIRQSLHQALLALQQLEVKGSQAPALTGIIQLVAQAGQAVEDGERAAQQVAEEKKEGDVGRQ